MLLANDADQCTGIALSLPSAWESNMWLRLNDGAVKELASRKSIPACGLKITSCISIHRWPSSLGAGLQNLIGLVQIQLGGPNNNILMGLC